MKLYLMVEVKGNLSEKEQEKLCWDMMEGSDVYSMVARESIKELQDALCEVNDA